MAQAFFYGTGLILQENFSRQFQRISKKETDPENPLSVLFGAKACDNINNYVQYCLNMKVISEALPSAEQTATALTTAHTAWLGPYPGIIKSSQYKRFRVWSSCSVANNDSAYFRVWALDKLPVDSDKALPGIFTDANSVPLAKWKVGEENKNWSYAEWRATSSATVRFHAQGFFPPNMNVVYFLVTYDSRTEYCTLNDVSVQIYFD